MDNAEFDPELLSAKAPGMTVPKRSRIMVQPDQRRIYRWGSLVIHTLIRRIDIGPDDITITWNIQ